MSTGELTIDVFSENRYVTLVFRTAEAKRTWGCIILSHVKQQEIQNPKLRAHPGRDFILDIQHTFEVTGPNGTHTVLVTDPWCPTLDEFMLCQRDLRWRPWDGPQNHQLARSSFKRELVRRLLLGLDYVHSCGLVLNSEFIGEAEDLQKQSIKYES
jgi:hypothetical protein